MTLTCSYCKIKFLSLRKIKNEQKGTKIKTDVPV